MKIKLLVNKFAFMSISFFGLSSIFLYAEFFFDIIYFDVCKIIYVIDKFIWVLAFDACEFAHEVASNIRFVDIFFIVFIFPLEVLFD